MALRGQGSLEIEQTLTLARDAVEVDIARYRLALFGVAALLSGAMRLAGQSDTWAPCLTFAVGLVYAIALRLFLARVGNRPPVAVVSLLLDLCVSAAVFVVPTHFLPIQTRAAGSLFLAYILGPNLMFMLLINSLRSSPVSSLVGACVAPVIYFATVWTVTVFHPAQMAVGTLLALAGVIGVAVARQTRKNLDRFARLQLLRRYLPPEAVDRVMRDHPDEALSLGGRLVTVTLLSADLRGFTAMSEKLSPDEVMAQLNAYHGAMIEVIERHGGVIDKFIGDGTLVVFGLVGTPESAARAAVDCAGEMLEALERHNTERATSGAPALRMGIGIHTGPVIAGNLGVPGRRLEFTVIGDAVNTASRLEGETKAQSCAVVVSAATAELLADGNALRELGPVSIRGKERSMRIFGLVRDP